VRALQTRPPACRSRVMTQPQDPARRLKQKRRRETQLAKWRAKQPAKAVKAEGSAKATPAKAKA
jgi:hypothetical protein